MMPTYDQRQWHGGTQERSRPKSVAGAAEQNHSPGQTRSFVYRPGSALREFDVAIELLGTELEKRDYILLVQLFDRFGDHVEPVRCTWKLSSVYGCHFWYVGGPTNTLGLLTLPRWSSEAYFSEVRLVLRPWTATHPDTAGHFGLMFVGENLHDTASSALPHVLALIGQDIE